MKKIITLLTSLFALFALVAMWASPTQAGPADCSATGIGGFTPLGSISFDYTCSTDQTVYFGVCDSGGVPNDDLFDVRADGLLVSYNYYVGGTDEYTVMSQSQAKAGVNTAVVNSLNTTPYPPATYSYIVSPNSTDVPAFLASVCGVDWKGLGSGVSSACDTTVNIFTEDKAPTDGTLEVHVLLGNEASFADEIHFSTVSVSAGDQLNNVPVPNVTEPRFVRIWWQPDGSTDWSYLPTQYWHGGGTLADEYGVSCDSGISPPPSYHTSFASAIPESNICFDLLNGCK